MIRSVLFMLSLSFLLPACSTQPVYDFHYLAEGNTSIWPEPPAIPRYRLVGILTGEPNYLVQKESRGFFSFLTGLYGRDRNKVLLQRPQSGFTDANGDIYVTDPGQQAVFVFRNNPPSLEQWNDAAKGIRFQSPVAIIRGIAGRFFVTDADLGQVFVFSADGQPVGSFGKAFLQRPTGITYDPDQRLIYVSDTKAHDIKVFDHSNQLVDTIGERGDGEGQFNFPTHIHFQDGLLYVTDMMNARIQILDTRGDVVTTLGSRGLYLGNTPYPKGVTTDQDGNIYIVESYYDHLLVFSPEGEFLLPVSAKGKGFGPFYLPAGVWSDHNSRIYIADMFNGRIVVLQYLGET